MLPLNGRSTAIFVVTTVFLSISFIAVCLRCFVRLRIIRAFGWDDGLMVFAMVNGPGLNLRMQSTNRSPGIEHLICAMWHHGCLVWNRSEIGQSVGARHDGDRHVCMFYTFTIFYRNNSPANGYQWWWLGQTSYVWVCAIAKISIAMALLRLTITRRHTIIIWAVIAVTTIVGLVFWFMLTLQCQPVSFFWQRVRPLMDPTASVSGSCMNLDSIIAIAYFYSVTATCCDLTLGLLPIFLVWNLHMNTRTKAALAAILGMGCVYVFVYMIYWSAYTDKFGKVPVQQSSSAFPTSTIIKTRNSYVSLSVLSGYLDTIFITIIST